ncbi:phage transcriptional regulator, AlpA [Methylocella silvestris BL2]|uniref:Phage transcriptional regulator, AlpA n=1 Tax=Methylocella silvestris (strain DSM 15510 / CIP 108128 / LMG 27833 / NCIMB 13906 / BL2) TaxID=395965 RepID=B8EI03_METSB|nr:helix-turn-helix domain-containing protein [Methylocella silvestris]ACK50485.1 phage transcriptional regulator, AlpA [Methylocella silvestris BL2]
MSSPSAKTIAPLLDEVAVAALLGVSRACLRQWRVKGGGPEYVSVGRCVRYRESGVEAWLDARTRASTSQELRQ